MNLGLRPHPSMETETFFRAFREAALDEGCAKAVEIRGKRLMVIRLNGRLHAVENRCSHMGVPFEDGPLADGQLVCPWHSARFCAKSGDHRSGPGFCGLEKFAVRVRSGHIEIALRPKDLQPHVLSGKRAAAAFGVLAAETLAAETS